MEKISIELPLHAWNMVLQALSRQPYADVVELIAEIKQQGDRAVKPTIDENNTH
jgi:hypothetical protein